MDYGFWCPVVWSMAPDRTERIGKKVSRTLGCVCYPRSKSPFFKQKCKLTNHVGGTQMAQDKELTCKDCGQSFTFTAGEQEFFQARGFSEPIRCKACRDIRKSQKAERGFATDRKRQW